VCDWLNTNLVNLWKTIPAKDGLPTIGPFPTQEHLSKGRRVNSAASVASSLTGASPVADYFRQLELNLPPPTLPPQGTRNAWNKNLPVEDITYSFNATQFPQLLTSDKTSKSTATMAQASHSFITSPAIPVSAIMEGMVSNTVKSSISEFEKRRKAAAAAAFELRMSRLEKQGGSINQHFESMTGRMEQTIVKAVTADNGIIAQQRAHIQNQDTELNRMETIVEQLASHIQELLTRDRADSTPVCSPNRKIQRTDNQSDVGGDPPEAILGPWAQQVSKVSSDDLGRWVSATNTVSRPQNHHGLPNSTTSV
jgi:hypothetical protein